MQHLVSKGLTVTEEFEEVVLADLTFLSDSANGASNGGLPFAITRGNFTVSDGEYPDTSHHILLLLLPLPSPVCVSLPPGRGTRAGNGSDSSRGFSDHLRGSEAALVRYPPQPPGMSLAMHARHAVMPGMFLPAEVCGPGRWRVCRAVQEVHGRCCLRLPLTLLRCTVGSPAGADGNETTIVKEGHVIQVWVPSVAPRASAEANEAAGDKAGSYGVRWALFSHMPKPEAEEAEEAEKGEEAEAEEGEEVLLSGAPLASPKPGSAKIEIDAALRNLSLAACPNKTDELLSILAANVTVLFPGSEPLLLNDTTLQEDFFSSSFLPCGVRFTIADIAVGEGAPVPEPAAEPAASSAAANGNSLALAVTHLIYIDYATLSVGKALALWEGEKVKKPKAGANGQDKYSWKLTVIGWSSDLPSASSSSSSSSEGDKPAPRLVTFPQASLERALAERREALESLPASGSSFAVFASAALEAEAEAGRETEGVELKGSSKVDVWAGLGDAFDYFAANASAGDVVNSSLILSSLHPVLLLNPNAPTAELITEDDRLTFAEVSPCGPLHNSSRPCARLWAGLG